MLGLPMEIVGPVLGIGALIAFVVAGIVVVRVLPAKLSPQLPKSPELEDVQIRLGELEQLQQRVTELEERLDFAERLLARQHDPQRLSPPPDESAS